MTDQSEIDVPSSWERFLLELELARNYFRPYLLFGGGTARNPLLDSLLPTLLYVRMAELLDDAFEVHLQNADLRVPKKFGNSFNGRIEFLEERGVLKDPGEVCRIKDRRNELAHEGNKQATWEEVDADLLFVENELQHLEFVGRRPSFEYFGERLAFRESSEPDASAERDFRVGLKSEGDVVAEFGWTERLFGSEQADE